MSLRPLSGAAPPLPTPIKDPHDDDLCYGLNDARRQRKRPDPEPHQLPAQQQQGR